MCDLEIEPHQSLRCSEAMPTFLLIHRQNLIVGLLWFHHWVFFSPLAIPQIHILCLLITQLCCLHLRDSLSLAALSAATLLLASEDQHADPTRISSYYTFPNAKRDIHNRLQLATETYSSIHNGRVRKTNPSPTVRPETMRGTSARERLCSSLSPNPRVEDSAVQLEWIKCNGLTRPRVAWLPEQHGLTKGQVSCT